MSSIPFELAKDFLEVGRESCPPEELLDFAKDEGCEGRDLEVLFFLVCPWKFGPSEIHEDDEDMMRARELVSKAAPDFPLPPITRGTVPNNEG